MSDTKQKPDGWICEAPGGWYHWEVVSLRSEDGIFTQIVGSNFPSEAAYNAAVIEAKRQGWKARPFVFLDEGEK